MTKNDREHIQFILKCSDVEFEAWAETASIEEIEHTMELIRKARVELDEQEDRIFGAEDFDVSEAAALIERIKNVGKI